jgi:hypothetical protein
MSEVLHPWIGTTAAVSAARQSVRIPQVLLPDAVHAVGRDELESQALLLLTEFATAPSTSGRTQCARGDCGSDLAGLRKGAKFCSQRCRRQHSMDVLRSKDGAARPRGGTSADAVEASAPSHIGRMWAWPEADRERYAVREIGYALNNWLRTKGFKSREVPASVAIDRMNVAAPESDLDAYDWLTDWLEDRGVAVAGDETFEELAEAARHIRGEAVAVPLLAA